MTPTELALLMSVNVTCIGLLVVFTVWAGNVKLVGVSSTTVPVPCRDTLWPPPGALSVMLKVAVLRLILVGAKTTVIVQLLLLAILAGQVVFSTKSAGSAPVSAIVIGMALGDVLVNVTGSLALVPSNSVLNVRLLGETSKGKFSMTETRSLGAVGSPPIVTTRSGLPSPVRSAALMPVGSASTFN